MVPVRSLFSADMHCVDIMIAFGCHHPQCVHGMILNCPSVGQNCSVRLCRPLQWLPHLTPFLCGSPVTMLLHCPLLHLVTLHPRLSHQLPSLFSALFLLLLLFPRAFFAHVYLSGVGDMRIHVFPRLRPCSHVFLLLCRVAATAATVATVATVATDATAVSRTRVFVISVNTVMLLLLRLLLLLQLLLQFASNAA